MQPATLNYAAGERLNSARLIVGAGIIAMLCPVMIGWLACARLLGQLNSGRWQPVLAALPMLFLYAGVVAATVLLGGVFPRRDGVRWPKRTVCLLVAVLNALLMLASDVFWGVFLDQMNYGSLTPLTRRFLDFGALADWLAMFPQIVLVVAAPFFIRRVAAWRNSRGLVLFSRCILAVCTGLLATGMVIKGTQVLPHMVGYARLFRFPYELYDAGVMLFHGLQCLHWCVVAIWALRGRTAAG